MLLNALACAVVAFLGQPEPAVAPPGPPAEVSSERLMETIAALPEKRSGSGTDEHRRGLARAQEMLVHRLESLALDPALEPVEWTPPLRPDEPDPFIPEWNNIVVDLPGDELPGELLIVAAHYDAVPESPGADDNGTGVAAVLELARVLRDEPMRRTVRLILFTLEEEWLIGSQQYVRRHAEAFTSGEETIVGMISLDGLGYFTDEPDSQRSPITPRPGVFEPPTVGDFIAIGGIVTHRDFSQGLTEAMRAAAPDLNVFTADFFPIAPPDLLRSDHAPFLLSGFPAVMMTDTANFRSPHYHTATDTIDTIDVARYTLVVRARAGATHAIAEPVGSDDGADAGEPDESKGRDEP